MNLHLTVRVVNARPRMSTSCSYRVQILQSTKKAWEFLKSRGIKKKTKKKKQMRSSQKAQMSYFPLLQNLNPFRIFFFITLHFPFRMVSAIDITTVVLTKTVIV